MEGKIDAIKCYGNVSYLDRSEGFSYASFLNRHTQRCDEYVECSHPCSL